MGVNVTGDARFLSDRDWEKYFRDYWTLDELPPYQHLRSTLLARVDISPDSRVLDVGCGPGLYAPSILSQGAEYTGIDGSAVALAEARRHCTASNSVRFIQMDLRTGLRFDAGSFDRAICNNVLYILQPEERRRVLSEVNRVLASNGVAAFSEPGVWFNPVTLYLAGVREEARHEGFLHAAGKLARLARPTLAILRMNAKIKREAEAGAYHWFTENEMLEMLERGGLRIRECFRAYANQNVCVVGVRDAQ
jgi:SAM-dependent methyltransferase